MTPLNIEGVNVLDQLALFSIVTMVIDALVLSYISRHNTDTEYAPSGLVFWNVDVIH